MKWSKVYFYNGLAMLMTFTVVRILPIPYSYYIAYNSLQWPTAYWHFPLILIVGFCLDAKNIYWYRKMIIGAISIMKGREPPITENHNSGLNPADDKTD